MKRLEIWKKQIRMSFILYGVDKELRKSVRRMRQDSIRHMRQALISDLMNRHHVGDIVILPEDLAELRELKRRPILIKIEVIHRKYT
jgi:hypothetical protein